MNMSNITTMPDERSERLVEEILSLPLQAQPPLTLVSALGVLDQSGWTRLEAAAAKRERAISELLKILNKAKDDDECVFIDTMHRMGWEPHND